MILDFTNLNKNQQIEFDKIFFNYKNKIEKLIYKILRNEKKEIIFFNLIARNPIFFSLSIIVFTFFIIVLL